MPRRTHQISSKEIKCVACRIASTENQHLSQAALRALGLAGRLLYRGRKVEKVAIWDINPRQDEGRTEMLWARYAQTWMCLTSVKAAKEATPPGRIDIWSQRRDHGRNCSGKRNYIDSC